MKKILYLLLTLFGCTLLANGQDFKPGQQAQGILESKNVTVDHATGTFHYRVPLYTLKSGAFELPVTLDYTARGVRVDDLPGPVGYNWTLNTGGVVTRTVRGGMADELSDGYAHSENAITPLWDDVTNVNLHRRDGESDIFTAVFNGRSVNFLIRKKANGTLYAEPLELTAVKIEPVSDWSGISAWTVTDEMGNRYLFEEREQTVNLNLEENISFNGLRNYTYTSAWYLSRIEPLNAEPITFIYKTWQPGEKVNAHLDYHHQNIWTGVWYKYGRKIVEYPFDFQKYKEDFDKALAHAQEVLKEPFYESLYQAYCNNLINSHNWINAPTFKAEDPFVQYNKRTLGIIADLRNVSMASSQLLNSLESMINTYQNSGRPQGAVVASYLKQAKSYVYRCLNEKNMISEKYSSNSMSYEIYTPILKEIHCMNSKLVFQHQSNSLQYPNRLTNIILYSLFNNTQISEITLQNDWVSSYSQEGGLLLYKLSFKDKNGQEYQQMKFDYFYNNVSLTYDPWGYYKQNSDDWKLYKLEIDPVYNKRFSLKSITLPQGGLIQLDYEPNTISYYPATADRKTYGGIRLASIVLQSSKEAAADSISYSYPSDGTIVYNDYSNSERINYQLFSDYVTYSRVKYKGCAFTNTGNNGLYYRHVIETIHGKGSTSYLFHVPYYANSIRSSYTFWMNGLPLAIATYDKDGHIRNLKKNIYYADFSNPMVLTGIRLMKNTAFFVPADSARNYLKILPQLQVFEHYLNKEYLEQHYKSMTAIGLGDGKVLNPYQDLYVPNILPRINVVIPSRQYNLYYGGVTLLQKQQEFIFENNMTDSISINDFYNLTSGSPYKDISYEYDTTSFSVHPIKTSEKISGDDTRTIIQLRVANMNTNNDIIEKMKRLNVLNPIVKEAKIRNNTLLEEQITFYEVVQADSCTYVGQTSQYCYTPKIPMYYQPDNTKWFTFDSISYKSSFKIKNDRHYQSYVPIEKDERSQHKVFRYSELSGNRILEAENVSSRNVAACDITPIKFKENILLNVKSFLSTPNYQVLKHFWQGYQKMDKQKYGQNFVTYTKSNGHAYVIRMLELMTTSSLRIDLTEVMTISDSLRTNPDHILLFCNQYKPIISNDSAFHGINFYDFQRSIQVLKTYGLLVCPYSYWVDLLKVTVKPDKAKKWSIYVLDRKHAGIKYKITSSNNEYIEVLKPSSNGFMDYYELDTSKYNDVSSIEVECAPSAWYIAILPQHTSFQAAAYNDDGTVAVKFDQTSKAEIYEYDPAGRIIRIMNQRGETLKTYEYNNFKQQ
ncbi:MULTISPECIES: hypothetical protein [Mediterranea]|uniref:hypothetical protein n=1 Tax=Mediterranea TaxID=1926659 RepID=UPI0020132E74|nr:MULTISPECIES: hypothetical protein [Mediterranea]MCL1608743.1 hypothetical protein [Mediterranea sp. ET5]MDM8123477.1 hypothetical protein [Mediterranea massiliensis]MDM8197540.1 hypothetical protein [Mediterranea massiliensis]